ncbi:MAG: hypothetical protein HY699_19635 [Deltaproteobacteria bacterium]|nr:hypothetical protein [Deltaproteobacteria bacterium]
MTLGEIIDAEWRAVSERRRRYQDEPWFKEPRRSFGLAISGGGIRSATIGLGFLAVLNRFGILERADYLSTVSGGGYLGGHVQAKLWRERQAPKPFNSLFQQADLDHLRYHGDYLAPGGGWKKHLHRIRMAGAVVASIALNFVWVIALTVTIARLAYLLLGGLADAVIPYATIATAGVLGWHLFMHGLRHVRLWSSDALNSLEGILLVGALVWAAVWMNNPHPDLPLSLPLAVLVVAGFFTNPNLLTMHRFYRDRLQTAYLLRQGGDRGAPIALHELWTGTGPYPLINACLNVLGEHDPKFAGAAGSDYFLLSPLFCGSKLTDYAATTNPGFNTITLATAVACAGAAVNPGLGPKSNRLLAFVMALLNLRLGYWVPNPKVQLPGWLRRFPWWPYYLLRELLSTTDTQTSLVNIADGGFIENLGVFELLRRRCTFIIVLDASADPRYELSDLNNLVMRARSELGVLIKFRQDPERLIRPLPSQGYSRSHFVVADISDMPGKEQDEPEYTGVLVYVKSSVREQQRWKKWKDDASGEWRGYVYKTYHPDFPHESTADQFFDEAQWFAYYTLGRFLAGDVLGLDLRQAGLPATIAISDLYQQLSALGDEQALLAHPYSQA